MNFEEYAAKPLLAKAGIAIPQGRIATSVEELEHFRDVYAIMERRGIQLSHEIPQDMYIKQLLQICRDGRNERFMDRLLLASLVETRGAERFRLVYEALEEEDRGSLKPLPP